jgi:hypothetical protein
MKTNPLLIILSVLPLTLFAQDEECITEEPAEECCPEPEEICSAAPETICCEPDPRWYFTLKPGYYYFTDSTMREFFDNGGFTLRGEAGCRFWGPLAVWMDGSYFHKDGTAIGGTEDISILLGTLTLGLKTIFYFNKAVAFYAGAGPRLFLMILKNDSPFIRSEDNQMCIGGGFNAGFWFFPFANFRNYSRNLYLDLFADYSLGTMRTEEDEFSTEDFDVNVSGITGGLGLGIRF